MFVLVNLVMGFGGSLMGLLTNEASANRCSLLRTALALSKVRLCQAPFVFGPNSTKADAVAVEADFDGYADGGNTITAWGVPLGVTGGGSAIAAETTFAYADDTGHVANTISSGWIELAGGNILMPFNLVTPITFQHNGDGVVLQFLDTEGAG